MISKEREDLARFINGKPNKRLQKIIDTAPEWIPKYEAKVRAFMWGTLYQESQPAGQLVHVERE